MAQAGASAQAGVYTQASLNAGMGAVNANGNNPSGTPATWTYIWFALAVLFILGVYFGFGGHRGAVAS